MGADLDEIDDVGGWLVMVVSRMCLDQLRSERRRQMTVPAARCRRSAPRLGTVDPADRITLDDVRIALHVVLDRLMSGRADRLRPPRRVPVLLRRRRRGRGPDAQRRAGSSPAGPAGPSTRTSARPGSGSSRPSNAW